jgi:tetratricopeptide (TPR) repeat protein
MLIAILSQPIQEAGVSVVEMRRKVDEAVVKGRLDEAISIAESGVKAETQAHPEGHDDVSRAMRTLAGLYLKAKRFEDAEALGRKGLAIVEKIAGPDSAGVAAQLGVIAKAKVGLKAYDQADAYARKALAIVEKLPGQRLGVCDMLRVLAEAKLGLKEFPEAEALARRSLAVAEEVVGPDSTDLLDILVIVSEVYRVQKLAGQTLLVDQRRAALAEKLFGVDSSDNIDYLKILLLDYYSTRRNGDAEAIQRRILKLTENSGIDIEIAKEAETLAHVLYFRRKYLESEEVLRRALALREKAQGPESLSLTPVLDKLVTLTWERSDFPAAEALLLRIAAIREKAQGPSHVDLVYVHHNLETVYAKQGRLDQAQKSAERAISIGERAISVIEKTDGSDSPKIASILGLLAPMHLVMDRPQKAAEASERAEKINERSKE